jgi:hypothetical protein
LQSEERGAKLPARQPFSNSPITSIDFGLASFIDFDFVFVVILDDLMLAMKRMTTTTTTTPT